MTIAPDLETVTAVVLNWRTPGLAIKSARALLDDGVPPERVVLVDNASGDDSCERLRRELPRSPLVALDENVGFARGNNAGARALPGRSYLFVNSDAFVRRRGSVVRLLDAVARPDVGLAVPRLLNEDGTLQPSVAPFHSPAVALVRASGLSRLLPNSAQPRWSTHWDHGRSREVASAIGAVMLVRGETWEALGGFDERRFMYAEDLDLCWRVAELGWKTWFEADAEFVHLGSSSAGRRWSDPERAAAIGRSESAMIRDHLPALSARATLAFVALGLGARWSVQRALGRRAAAASLAGSLRGFLDR